MDCWQGLSAGRPIQRSAILLKSAAGYNPKHRVVCSTILVYEPNEDELMKRLLLVLLLTVSACGRAADESTPEPLSQELCSAGWYQAVEDATGTGDGQGHGPDLGSDEWKSVVEFKLGVRGASDVPPRSSEAWCRYIDAKLRSDSSATAGPGPAYSCDGVETGSIEELVCLDAELSLLDRQLTAVYRDALSKAANEHPPTLKAEQRGWIKGRDDCWKSDDERSCVETAYQQRIAGLQARYRLTSFTGPVYYFCDGNRSNEVVVTFFDTDPATLIAERGDSVSLMYRQRSASGARYEGRNESFWDHHGEARITWGYEAPEMRCEKTP